MLNRTVEWAGQALPGILGIRMVGVVSIGSPMTFVSSGLRIKDNDPMIHVSVRDIEFMRRFIDNETRRATEIFHVVASAVFPTVANLHEKFPVVREFENLIVFVS